MGPVNFTLLLLIFASTKFCDLGILMILRVLIFAISLRSRANFAILRNQGKSSTFKSTCFVNVAVSRLNCFNVVFV